LKGEGINSGDARTNIISGIKDLAPKGSAIIRDETLVLPKSEEISFCQVITFLDGYFCNSCSFPE